jgi:hypothetical protein
MVLAALRRCGWPLAIALAFCGLASVASAAPEQTGATSRVPKPSVEAARGDKCVEDTQFMRRSHMQLLKHQRDETVHRGVRTTRHSLKGCIECHASRKTGSVAASGEDFCQSCHAYAAVKIDCFECHASRPDAATRQSLMSRPGGAPDFALAAQAKP